jgi:hypothetical protein
VSVDDYEPNALAFVDEIMVEDEVLTFAQPKDADTPAVPTLQQPPQ